MSNIIIVLMLFVIIVLLSCILIACFKSYIKLLECSFYLSELTGRVPRHILNLLVEIKGRIK